MGRRFDHMDLRVPDMARARPFYQRLLPLLGFTVDDSDAQWLQCMAGGVTEAAEFFGVIESPDHRPNENRVAFWAASIAEVDALSARLNELGAGNVEGPDWEAPHYYAVYFEDPAGNRLEICHRTLNKP
jgi:catechol 2,3-dioxygenase-like lactoylglutathione lyase family enzyme